MSTVAGTPSCPCFELLNIKPWHFSCDDTLLFNMYMLLVLFEFKYLTILCLSKLISMVIRLLLLVLL